MKNRFWFQPLLLAGSLTFCGNSFAAQIVTPVMDKAFMGTQESFGFSETYTVSSPNTAQSTGLGIRIHYNASQLEHLTTSPYAGSAQPVGASTPDTEDYDHDPATDQYFVLAWIDFSANWPGTGKLPLHLLDATFKTRSTFSTATRINTSATATALNAGFQSSSMLICAKPTVSIIAGDASAAEQGLDTASFTVQLDQALPADCGDLTLHLQTGGTASAGTDFVALPGSVTIPATTSSVAIPLTPLDDTEPESGETIVLSLQASDQYQMGSAASATVTLLDNDQVVPEVNLAVNHLKVLEGREDNIMLTVIRNSVNVSAPLDVFLQASGSASAGSDYQTLPASVRIPAGASFATLSIGILDNAVQENNENLQINIVDKPAYQPGALSSLSVLIEDDELRDFTSLPVKATPVPPVQVPTLSEWLMLMLGALLAGMARSGLRRGLKG